MTVSEMFQKHDSEYHHFERIPEVVRYSNRADLHAFIMLDKIVPGITSIISAAEHDEVYLGFEVTDLEGYITEEQVKDLLRCGVMLNEGLDSLYMFA